MSGTIRIDVHVDERLLARMRQAQELFEKRFRQAMFRAERAAKKRVSGDVLNVHRGRLRASITSAIEGSGRTLVGRLGASVIYARIHELGGTIPAHEVRAKKRKALRFEIGGQVIFRRVVHIPPITMPPRPYLRPSLEEAFERFEQDITADVARITK